MVPDVNCLEVLQIFAKLLTEPDSRLGDKSYTEILRERADHLQKLVQFKTEHDDTLQAWLAWRNHVFPEKHLMF